MANLETLRNNIKRFEAVRAAKVIANLPIHQEPVIDSSGVIRLADQRRHAISQHKAQGNLDNPHTFPNVASDVYPSQRQIPKILSEYYKAKTDEFFDVHIRGNTTFNSKQYACILESHLIGVYNELLASASIISNQWSYWKPSVKVNARDQIVVMLGNVEFMYSS